MWDIAYDEEMDHIQGHKGEVTALHYNAEFPSKIMSGGAYPDDTIKIWDRYSFQIFLFLKSHILKYQALQLVDPFCDPAPSLSINKNMYVSETDFNADTKISPNELTYARAHTHIHTHALAVLIF